MPRPNLRHPQAIVREFCHQHGVAYRQTTLVALLRPGSPQPP
jgi:hypothetical protein